MCFESHSDRALGTEKEEMALKLRLSSGDISGFKFLFSLALMYGLMAMLVYSIIHMKFVKPLGIDAPLNRFSEDRAVKHVRVLSEEIDGRQVSLNISIPIFFFFSIPRLYYNFLFNFSKLLLFVNAIFDCWDRVENEMSWYFDSLKLFNNSVLRK